VYNKECVRIECNQFTVVEGGSLEWREEDLYERTRPCTSSTGFWTGNVKTPKEKEEKGEGKTIDASQLSFNIPLHQNVEPFE
jgi:hypothetical protein